MRRLSPSPLVILASLACTPHEEAPDPRPPQAEPAIVQEAEPEVPLPPIVAPALPALAPSRPLANLELLWQHTPEDGPAPDTLWSIGATPVAMSAADAKRLGVAGPPDALGDLERPYGTSFRRAGPLLLALASTEFIAFDAGTGGVRWSTPPGLPGYSYEQFVSPRALVASFYDAEGDAILAWALEDGRGLWTRKGGGEASFTRIQHLWTDGVRGYFTSEPGLEAFVPATGVTLWKRPRTDERCGVATGGGRVLVEDPGGHVILDAELGTEIGRLPRTASACSWNEYEDIGVAPAVITRERVYVFDSGPPAGGSSTLRAFATDFGGDGAQELWAASGFGDDTLVVDQDAVYVMRDGQTLVALDADTGKVATEISVGGWFAPSVEPVGGVAGPLVIAEDGDGNTWIFGRGEQALPPEDWEIRGRLISDGYVDKQLLASVHLYVGGEKVKVDARGRFVARGSGRGIVRVETREDYDGSRWRTVGVDPRKVRLDGSGRYDLGEIEAFEISME